MQFCSLQEDGNSLYQCYDRENTHLFLDSREPHSISLVRCKSVRNQVTDPDYCFCCLQMYFFSHLFRPGSINGYLSGNYLNLNLKHFIYLCILFKLNIQARFHTRLQDAFNFRASHLGDNKHSAATSRFHMNSINMVSFSSHSLLLFFVVCIRQFFLVLNRCKLSTYTFY